MTDAVLGMVLGRQGSQLVRISSVMAARWFFYSAQERTLKSHKHCTDTLYTTGIFEV